MTKENPWLVKLGSRFARFVLVSAILLCGNPPRISAQEVQARAEPASEEYAAALRQARDRSREGRPEAAIRAYAAANELVGGESAHCLLEMTSLYNTTRDYESAIASARKVIGLTEDPHSLQRAHQELGLALAMGAKKYGVVEKDRKVRKRLQEAETSLRQALSLGVGDGEIHYLLANVLADQMVTWKEWHRHEEIKVLASKYLELQPEGAASYWARKASCQVYTPSPADQAAGLEPLEIGPDEPREFVRPVKLSAPQPHYPMWARKARIEGRVVVQAIIDKEGDVSNAKVLEDLPLCLGNVAAAAIVEWKFEPALLEGEPVDVYYNLIVNFRLK